MVFLKFILNYSSKGISTVFSILRIKSLKSKCKKSHLVWKITSNFFSSLLLHYFLYFWTPNSISVLLCLSLLILNYHFFVLLVQTKPTAKTLLDPKRAQNLGKITCSKVRLNFLQFSVVWPLISHDFRQLAVKMLWTPEALDQSENEKLIRRGKK